VWFRSVFLKISRGRQGREGVGEVGWDLLGWFFLGGCWFFETECPYAPQDGLKLLILLLQPSGNMRDLKST
jgi:hypothetical protein